MRAVRTWPVGEMPVARRLGEAPLPSLRPLRGLPRVEGPGGSIATTVETFLDAVARFDAAAPSPDREPPPADAEPSAEHPILDAVLVTLGVPREAPRESQPTASPAGLWLAALAPPVDAPVEPHVERDGEPAEVPTSVEAVPGAVLATLFQLGLTPSQPHAVRGSARDGVPPAEPARPAAAPRIETEAGPTRPIEVEPPATRAPTEPAPLDAPARAALRDGGGDADAIAVGADEAAPAAGAAPSPRAAVERPAHAVAEGPAWVVTEAVAKAREGGEPPREHADHPGPHGPDAAPPASEARPAEPGVVPVLPAIEPGGADALHIVRAEVPSLPAPAEVPQREVTPDRWAVREGYVAVGAPDDRASIELAHPTLGALTLELAGETRRLSIDVAAPSLTAAIALRGAEEELRRDLAASGADLGRFRVRTRSAPTAQDAGASGTWQPRPSHERRRS